MHWMMHRIPVSPPDHWCRHRQNYYPKSKFPFPRYFRQDPGTRSRSPLTGIGGNVLMAFFGFHIDKARLIQLSLVLCHRFGQNRFHLSVMMMYSVSTLYILETGLVYSSSLLTSNFSYDGYIKMNSRNSNVIFDCGDPQINWGDYHAGTLSFEFCYGKEMIIVNCGSNNKDNNQIWISSGTGLWSTRIANMSFIWNIFDKNRYGPLIRSG